MTDTGRKLAGRYALGEVLGRGGMGTVYRARDEVLDREVAVKVLPESVADRDPTNIARFEREARSAAALNHRGVVSVYDAGADDGVRYIVMELVDGRSLEAVLKGEGAIDPARVAQIGVGVADALAAAHAAGIVHRDIKPANVMLAADGTVKVLDFGIARAVEGVTLTQTASVIGTAAYMAPEQVTGAATDERSDLYSLGCVLYALLVGHAAFRGENAAAILHQQASVDPPPPSQESPGIPRALDGLVMGLLAKDPAQRPQGAATVKDQLSAIVASADTADAGRTAPTVIAGAAGAAAADLPRRTYRTGRLGARAEPDRVERTRVQPLPTAPTAATERVASSIPTPSHRALWIGGGVLALIILLALILGGNRSLPTAHNAAASHTTTSTQAKRTHSSTTTSTHASRTTPAPPATTVPGAIAQVQSLIAADQRAGTVDAQGAQPLTAKLTEVQQSVAAGNLTDAQHHEIELAQMVAQLQGQGHVKPAAAAPLTTAVARLGTLLDQAVASASSTTPTGPPAPGKGKGHGKGNGNGNGNGNGDGGD